MYRAVIFDLGGVVFPSPFDAFDAHERAAGLDPGAVRALIRVSSEAGAWAALERGELSMAQFVTALDDEAEAAGFRLDAARLMQAIGERAGPRPQMLTAIARIREHGLRTAALTNNWVGGDGRAAPHGLRDLLDFDVVVESSVVGLRKPDPRIYHLVLDELGVDASDAVFLDDLGVNLKPARALGLTTIKVGDPDVALAELERVLGFPLTNGNAGG